MTERKAVIKNADMSEEMQQDAVDCATQALEKYNIEKVCFMVQEYNYNYRFVAVYARGGGVVRAETGAQ